MRRSGELPDGLGDGPFRVADARARGVTRARLAGRDLLTPTRGVRLRAPSTNAASQDGGPSGVKVVSRNGAAAVPDRDPRPRAAGDGDPDARPRAELVSRARAFAQVLPGDAAYSHHTSLALWGVPLPGWAEGSAELHVMRPTYADRVRRRGCRGHRGLELREVAQVRGVKVTDLADSWVDLGEVLPLGLTHEDLVVAGDDIARRLGGIEPLATALALRRRALGKPALTAALDAVRHPVRSRMETVARLTFVRAGLPEPTVNAAVRDAHGEWLLEADLVWEEERVVAEYQGKHHASIRERGKDAAKRALAEDEGWTVVEVFGADLCEGRRGCALLDRLARALGIDPGTLTDPWSCG